MHQAVLQSARTEQLETLVAFCRGGEQENLALRAHQRMGWEPRGTFNLEGGTYHLITLDVRLPHSSARAIGKLERSIPEREEVNGLRSIDSPARDARTRRSRGERITEAAAN